MQAVNNYKGEFIMENINMEQIIDVYKKLEIPMDDLTDSVDFSSQKVSQNWKPVPFGIYVEKGFNYSNNTNFHIN